MSDPLPARVATRLRGGAARFGATVGVGAGGGAGAPVTLRRRLVVGFVALVVLLTVLIGTVSVLALRSSLVDQLDDELDQAVSRAVAPFGGGGPALTPDDGDLAGPRQAPGTFTAIVAGGAVDGIVLDQDGTVSTVRAARVADALGDLDQGVPSTVDLGEGLGHYRVESVTLQGTTTGGAVSTVTLVVGLPTTSVTQTTTAMVVVIAVVTLVGLAVAVALAAAVVRRALRPLERMADTALSVAELPLDRGEVALAERVADEDADVRTEVGRVGAALNRMLGHVAGALTARQRSEEKVRQFVADASHELRTPLASIRGYSELTRRMHVDLPDDVVHAMARIESESLRMTSLVEDLLLLARLDEGRDLVVGEVDLTRIAVDAVGDAHVAGPSHEFDVTVPDEPVTVPGDGLRLHQVVANLLTNARTHTPAGTHVHLALGVDECARQAVVEVSDDGPGIDAKVLPVLFERFARGDDSRSRKAGSTGLGLAIVDAVVHAHGGTVTVASSGAGAAFTVRLPLDAAPAAPATAPADGAPAGAGQEARLAPTGPVT